MFDNPEKLFIILLIALFILGPQKLIGLGGAMGRAIRDFRGAVRNAQDEFKAAVDEVQRTGEDSIPPEPAALPAPEPVAQAASLTVPDGSTAPPAPSDQAPDHEGPHSLASEPSARTVLESLGPKE